MFAVRAPLLAGGGETQGPGELAAFPYWLRRVSAEANSYRAFRSISGVDFVARKARGWPKASRSRPKRLVVIAR